MGRENLIKAVKSRGTKFIVLGIFVGLISLFMTLVMLTDGFSAPVFIFLLLLALGVFFIVYGADYARGANSRYVKKYPKMLELADTLNNVVFENEFFIVSDRAFAVKKNVSQIADLNEVLAIYEHIMTQNGIVTQHDIKLELLDGRTISVNVYAKKRQVKDNLVLTISNFCPNARVGYSAENMEYVKQKRKEYKNN